MKRIALVSPPPRTPITGIAGCCPRATNGHAAALPSAAMNSRHLMASPPESAVG